MEDDWKSFVVSKIIKQTLLHAQDECTGCKEGRYCALIHACATTSLLRKLECFYDNRVKMNIWSNLEGLLKEFEERFILMDRRERYIALAQTLLDDLNSHVIYYGRFITILNDSSICGTNFTPLIKEEKIDQNDDTMTKILRNAMRDHDDIESIADVPAKQRRRTTGDKKLKKSKNAKKCKQTVN